MKKGSGRQVRIIMFVFLAVVLYASFPFGRFSSNNFVQEGLFSQKYAYSQFLSFFPISASIKNLPKPGALNLTGNITIDGDAALDAFCAGNGTDGLAPASAYVIQNLNFSTNGSDYGIVIQDTTRFLTIRNCTLTNVSYRGIYLNNATNTVITDCNIEAGEGNEAACIKCYNVTMVNVTNCILSNGWESGITLMNSTDSFISDNSFIGNQIGIYVDWDSLSNTISGNNIGGFGESEGIEIYENSTGNFVLNNTIFGVNGNGIAIDGSSFNVLTSNNASSNSGGDEGGSGILIEGASYCYLTQNIANNNSWDGIAILDSDNCFVFNNTELSNLAGNGIDLVESNYCSISNNNASFNIFNGINLYDSDFNTITGNFFSGNQKGCIQIYFDYNIEGGGESIVNGVVNGGENYWREFVNWNLIYNNVGCFYFFVPGEGLWILAGIIIAIIGISIVRKHRYAKFVFRWYSHKTGIPEQIFRKEMLLQEYYNNLRAQNWKKIWQTITNTKNLAYLIIYFDQILCEGPACILFTKSERFALYKFKGGKYYPQIEEIGEESRLSSDPRDPTFVEIYEHFVNNFERFYKRNFILIPVAEFRNYSKLIQTVKLNLFFRTDAGRVKRLFAQFPKFEFKQSGYFFLQIDNWASIKIELRESSYDCSFFMDNLRLGLISFNLRNGSLIRKDPENAQELLANMLEESEKTFLKINKHIRI